MLQHASISGGTTAFFFKVVLEANHELVRGHHRVFLHLVVRDEKSGGEKSMFEQAFVGMALSPFLALFR